MTENKSKNNIEIELDAFETTVCKDKEMQSFLNVFHFKEENLNKSHLGEIFGVIQVFEHSQQNAYLPNLISQVLKKEFYANSKRTAEEAFEAALKKANVALSDLTRHEVASWIGKLHAVVGVVQNDNFFFTQAGGGRILLLRDKKISDLSRNLDKEDSDHPIKTFSDVSSGKLLLGDKVIFSTESFFETFSWEDLKRHANAFDVNEFDNLIKSTLELEGVNVGISIVNVKEKIITPIASLPRAKSKNQENFFGQQKKERIKASEKPSPKIEFLQEKKKKQEEKAKDASDDRKNLSPFEKQPELYIKEGDPIEIDKKQPDGVLDKLKGAIDKTKISAPSEAKAVLDKKNVPAKVVEESNKGDVEQKELIKKESIKIESKSKPTAPAKQQAGSNLEPSKTISHSNKFSDLPKKALFSQKIPTKKTIIKSDSNNIDEVQLSTELAKKNRKKQRNLSIDEFYQQNSKKKTIKKSQQSEKISVQAHSLEKTKPAAIHEPVSKSNYLDKAKKLLTVLFNQFSSEFNKIKTKKSESTLSFIDILRSPYIFSTVIISIILILLLIVFFRKDSPDYLSVTQIEEEPTDQTEHDGVYISEEEVEIVILGSANSNISAIAGYKNDVYVFTENNTFYRYDSNVNEFRGVPASDQVTDIVSMVEMPVLNLIFLVSNDSVHSYSPVLERFDQHKIKFPDDIDIIGAGVHGSFSFLYVFDRNSGQVYRYPRTEGGFGSSINWFQEPVSAENVKTFAIDDGIRVSYSDGIIEQYYQKKLINTFLIDTDPKVVPETITTDNEMSSYYILDSENPRVLKVNKTDNKVSDQYWNLKFENAKNMIIHNESEGYVVSQDNELLQFKLQ